MVLYLQQLQHQAVISHQNGSKRLGVIFTTRYRRWFSAVCHCLSFPEPLAHCTCLWATPPHYLHQHLHHYQKNKSCSLSLLFDTLFILEGRLSLQEVKYCHFLLFHPPGSRRVVCVGRLAGRWSRERDRAVKHNRNWRLKKEKCQMHYFL